MIGELRTPKIAKKKAEILTIHQRKKLIEMTNLIEVARMARQYVKPSSPTPPHCRNFTLSLLDQLAPSVYNPFVFFYPNAKQPNKPDPLHHLKQSLSRSLTRFYPFAGRIKDHISIDCNDKGVEFFDAKVDTTLENVLKEPNPNVLKHLLPIDIESKSTKYEPNELMHVQTNMFECGGVALSICWSHKICDGGTVSAFIKGWSRGSSGLADVGLAEYNASSIFPPTESSSIGQQALKLCTDRTATRRFVFDEKNVAALKAKAASSAVAWPTRVEAVSSLLWKCATKASRANSGTQPMSVMSQSVNIRRRISPPIPDSTIGNLVGYYLSHIEPHRSNNIELHDLVAKQRQGKAEVDNYVKKLQGNDAFQAIRELFKEAGTLLKRQDVNFYKSVSVCGDDLYSADFGWGSPMWVSVVSVGYKNTFLLNETRYGGGIEAWVTLKEEDMAVFERDSELIECASLNPSLLQ